MALVKSGGLVMPYERNDRLFFQKKKKETKLIGYFSILPKQENRIQS